MASFTDLLIPPRLVLRALDDLHTIALATDRFLELGERIDQRAERIERMGERVLELGERIEAKGAELGELGERIHAEGRQLDRRAREMIETGERLVETLPTIEQAVSLAQPLEGAVERLGRAVDMLPGGKGRASGAKERPR